VVARRRHVAFVIFRHAGPEVDVVDVNGTNRMVLAQDATMPVWSPDGREIAFARGEGELWAIDVASKAERKIAAPGRIVSPPDWQALR
jgi:Tol biopolymer transport system component